MYVSKYHVFAWNVRCCTVCNCSSGNINFIPCASAATTVAKRTQQHNKIFVFMLDQIITYETEQWNDAIPYRAFVSSLFSGAMKILIIALLVMMASLCKYKCICLLWFIAPIKIDQEEFALLTKLCFICSIWTQQCSLSFYCRVALEMEIMW